MKRSLRRSRQRGMVLIWVALVGLIMIAFVAIAADTAYVYLTGHQLQNAADSAALAGVWEVRDVPNGPTTAHDAAKAVAALNTAGRNAGGTARAAVQLASNPGNAAGGDIVIGVFDSGTQTFTPTFTSPNAVKVVARRTAGSPAGPLPLIFGPMAGVNNSNVSRSAIAVIGGQGVAAGLVLLNPHGTAIDLKGTGNTDKIIVHNGGIQVNSDSDDAVSWNGHANITADALYVGGFEPSVKNAFSINTVGINSPPVADPLGALPVPPHGTDRSANSITPLPPGYYPNGLVPKPKKGNITLAGGGVYFVRGGLSGGIDGTAGGGAMIYVETGNVNAELTVNAMTTGTYAGVAVFMARNNAGTISLGGNNQNVVVGTVYAPAATLDMHGTPDSAASQIIADHVSMNGTPQIIINYDGRFPVQGHKVWLAQ